MNKTIDATKLHEALNLLHDQLILLNAPAIELVVCGGSALIATGLILRTTQDVDILALMEKNQLESSIPLPPYLIEAADKVGKNIRSAGKLAQQWTSSAIPNGTA